MTVEEFSQKAVHRHGVDLYNAEDAIRLVELCRQASLPFLTDRLGLGFMLEVVY